MHTGYSILFDLDYTLYNMDQVLQHAFRNVAYGLSGKSGIPVHLIEAKLKQQISHYGMLHERLFNILLSELQLPVNVFLKYCIQFYHQSIPKKLTLYPGMLETLKELRTYCQLFLITDGNYGTQQKKVDVLGIEHYFKKIMYTNALGTSKPDAFNLIQDYFNIDPNHSIMVGDHPEKDIFGAKNQGVKTIRMLQGEYKDLPDIEHFEADFYVSDAKNIFQIINDIK